MQSEVTPVQYYCMVMRLIFVAKKETVDAREKILHAGRAAAFTLDLRVTAYLSAAYLVPMIIMVK
jgi:hypothetical protein